MTGEQGIAAAVASVLVALLAYLGARSQSRAAKSATDHTTRKDAQESALDAWERLITPTLEEVERLRGELDAVRGDLDTEREDRKKQQSLTEQEQASQRTMIQDLTDQVATWQRVAKTIARWATSLRDEVLRLGGTVPATPEELLVLGMLDEHEQRD